MKYSKVDIPNYWGGMSRPRVVVVLVFIGLALALATPSILRRISPDPVDEINWLTDLDQAMTVGVQSDKPLLLKFTADWCGPCIQMKRTVFPDSAVGSLIKGRFVPVVVDMTDTRSSGQTIASRYFVDALPTLIVLNPQGTELARKIGYVDTSQLLRWLGSWGHTAWQGTDPTQPDR